jgi:pyrroline-5-carboxylate reductase
MRKTIGIIGFGNMGQAIAGQIKDDYQVYVFEKDKSKHQDSYGIKFVKNSLDLVNKTDTLILAVKPQDFESLLAGVRDSVTLDKLIISIAAGISTAYIEKCLGISRVVRVMPNILLKIGSGITCLSKGKFATGQDLDFARNLFGYMGKTLVLEERLINAATAVSGSGPAYICYYIETGSIDQDNILEKSQEDFLASFKKAAQNLGFNLKEANLLVDNTFKGTIDFLKKTGISPSELIKQVSSKGGTTEAALELLRQGGSLLGAVQQAAKRAEELSRKE